MHVDHRSDAQGMTVWTKQQQGWEVHVVFASHPHGSQFTQEKEVLLLICILINCSANHSEGALNVQCFSRWKSNENLTRDLRFNAIAITDHRNN